MMIIGKIWDCEYPWDVRVEKVTRAFLDSGHEVHLFCRNRRNEPLHEVVEGLHIHRMPSWKKWGDWVDDVSSFPAFMNPRWVDHVRRGAREVGIDVLLCRDLPLSPLALRVGADLGVPVMVDIAENYPAMLKHRYHWRQFRPHNLLVRNPLLARVVETRVMRRADGVLAVVEESRERLIGLGAPRDRTVVVCNTPTLERIEKMGALRQGLEPQGGAGSVLRLVYLGLLGRSRGVDVLIEALVRLRERRLPVEVDLIGEDKGGLLRRMAERRGVEASIHFHGYVPYDRALDIVARADVGLVPHHATEHWRTTIPNKLFDYMAAGIPVLVSDAPPTKRIVSEEQCGRVFRDRDPRDLAEQIAALTDADARRSYGEAGRRAVAAKYNWVRDGKRLLELTARIVSERAASGKAEDAA